METDAFNWPKRLNFALLFCSILSTGLNCTKQSYLINFVSFVKTLMNVSLVNRSTNVTLRWEDVSVSPEDTTALVTLATRKTDNINAKVCLFQNFVSTAAICLNSTLISIATWATDTLPLSFKGCSVPRELNFWVHYRKEYVWYYRMKIYKAQVPYINTPHML